MFLVITQKLEIFTKIKFPKIGLENKLQLTQKDILNEKPKEVKEEKAFKGFAEGRSKNV